MCLPLWKKTRNQRILKLNLCFLKQPRNQEIKGYHDMYYFSSDMLWICLRCYLHMAFRLLILCRNTRTTYSICTQQQALASQPDLLAVAFDPSEAPSISSCAICKVFGKTCYFWISKSCHPLKILLG